MSEPLLSLTLICRDEKPNVKRCLDSLWDAVDEVCVVDTGSKDGTIPEFRRYAQRKKQPHKLKIQRQKWTEDFSAARNAADALASGEWLIWADLDDVVTGAANLRKLAAEASEDVVAFFGHYSYASDPAGQVISELWRERVVRNTGIPWSDRLHEHKLVYGHGTVVQIGTDTADWVHHRDHTQRTGQRNIAILEKWLAEDPENPRVMVSLATEYMGDERHQDAADMFVRYLQTPPEQGDDDRRAQATRHLCIQLNILNRPAEARAHALQALAATWLWADTHLTLAESEIALGHPDVALHHARNAIEIGKPTTLLIVNPQQYTAHPLALQSICLAQMGRHEDAVRACEQALEIAPSLQLAGQYLPQFRGALKRENTIRTFLATTDVMIEAGELLRAVAILDAAPYFVRDDERLVGRKTGLRRMIEKRRDAAEELEDGAADEFVARHLELVA